MGHYFLGIVFYHQNDLAQAEKYFRMAWESKYLLNSMFLSQTAFGLASVNYSQGRHNRAYEIVNSAAAYLLEMKDPNILTMIQAFEAELAISQDDFVTANQWKDQFNIDLVPPMITFYYPHFTLLEILFKQGTEEKRMRAFDVLHRLKDHAESSHNKNYLIKILVWEALFRKSSGDEKSALSALKQALNLAKPGGIIRLFMVQEPCMSNLLQKLEYHHDPFIDQISNILKENAGYAEANSRLIIPLTERELSVLSFLIKRLTNKEIAGQLNISTGTVKSHTIRIYQKLSVNNRREAVNKALSIGLSFESALSR